MMAAMKMSDEDDDDDRDEHGLDGVGGCCP